MDSTTRNGFRAFVIFSTLIGFGGLVDQFFPALLSVEMREHFAQAEVSAYGMALAIYSIAATFLGLVAVVGVLMFRRWARTLMALLTGLGIVALPFHNELISSGLSYAFSSLSSISSGVILALMFASPVKGYFEDKT